MFLGPKTNCLVNRQFLQGKFKISAGSTRIDQTRLCWVDTPQASQILAIQSSKSGLVVIILVFSAKNG